MLTAFQIGVLCSSNPLLYSSIYDEDKGEFVGSQGWPFTIKNFRSFGWGSLNNEFQEGLFWEYFLESAI